MIVNLEKSILALIDNGVDEANADELFAGGYLRGHLSIAAAQAEAQGEQQIEALDTRVRLSLQQAIAAGELSPPDRMLVLEMWQRWFQQATIDYEEPDNI